MSDTQLATLRICKTCGEAKAPDAFYKDARYPMGDIHCAQCRRNKVKAWRDKHPERAAEISRRSRSKNPQAARERAVNWHRNNRDKHLAYMKQRRASHGESIRDSKLKSVFGITLAEYNSMLEQQGGCCAICGKDSRANSKRLAVDHCHKTNRVRGLLCSPCNQALGIFKDSTQLLTSAINYLKKHE